MALLALALANIVESAVLLAQPGSTPLPPPPAEVVALDCAAKRMAFRAAGRLQPHRDPRPVFDALQLASQCDDTPPPQFVGRSRETLPLPHDCNAVWVHPGEPLQPALDRLAQEDPGRPRVLVLQDGTHFLTGKPLRIGPEHSGLTIRAAPGATPLLSGGRQLQTNWSLTTVSSGATALKASLRGQNINWTLRSVFVDGHRAIRARVPNADPEINGLHTAPHTGWFTSAAAWLPMAQSLAAKGNASIINVSSPRRPDTGIFPFFLQGRGGPVSQFEPPISYAMPILSK